MLLPPGGAFNSPAVHAGEPAQNEESHVSAPADRGFVASQDAMHEKACASTGLDDFGDPAYRTGLAALVEALDENANLSPGGRAIFQGQIVNTLATRLRCEQRLKEHPEAREVAIERPLVITGLVRTGSTALHYLLGQDPNLQNLEYWLSAQPQPRPPRSEWPNHPDFQRAEAELEFLYKTAPTLMAVHEMHADWPEECRHILAQSFTDDCYESAATLPGYTDWYHHASHRETYVRHKQLIQLISSTGPARRWLLKYPVHLRQLPALFEVYPDACVIQTHRDPRTVLASYTSFLARIRAVHETDVDPKAIAAQQLEGWAVAADAGLAFRKQHGDAQFFDLQFDDFMRDPLESVRRIYRTFDHELNPEAEERLRSWHAAHPQGKHGRHEYPESEFGVSESQILDRFGEYMQHFGMET
jgi:hypothetical protein